MGHSDKVGQRCQIILSQNKHPLVYSKCLVIIKKSNEYMKNLSNCKSAINDGPWKRAKWKLLDSAIEMQEKTKRA